MDFRKSDLRRIIPKNGLFTPTIIILIIVIGGILVLDDYKEYFKYFVIFLISPMIILDLIQFSKEDKLNETGKFWMSLWTLSVMIAIILALLFATKIA